MVKEGGQEYLNLSTVDASNFFKKLDSSQSPADFELEYKILSVPKHGQLFMGKRIQRPKYEFTQDDLEANRIRYVHDHSDSEFDNFELSATLVDVRYENVPNLVDIKERSKLKQKKTFLQIF